MFNLAALKPAIVSQRTVLYYTVFFISVLPEVNPNPCNTPGKTFKNVNCSSIVDLLIILLFRI